MTRKIPLRERQMFSTGDIAEICECSQQVVQVWIDTGVLPGLRMPGSRVRRVAREHLLRFLRDRGYPTDRIGDDPAMVLCVGLATDLTFALHGSLAGSRPAMGVTAVDGAFGAGAACTLRSPVALVVDLALGLFDARSLIGRVRASVRSSPCRVVAIATDETEAELERLGCDAVLRPPLDAGALLRAICPGEERP